MVSIAGQQCVEAGFLLTVVCLDRMGWRYLHDTQPTAKSNTLKDLRVFLRSLVISLFEDAIFWDTCVPFTDDLCVLSVNRAGTSYRKH